MKEITPRVIDFENKMTMQLPTEGWSFGKRLRTVLTVLTGGDVIENTPLVQYVNLRTSKYTPPLRSDDDSHHMP